ncbi:MAG TPA: hypothetical protein VGQ57_19675, partial [Polyangiaceae bacterium]|nr:hypothetical protein [Polyangiaceae bacterium]
DCGGPDLGNWCSNPGRALTEKLGRCDTCDHTPDEGTCNCVVGQCLWGPKSEPPRPAGGKK